MKVWELMSAPVYTISSTKSVLQATEKMFELGIGSLVVVDHGDVVGITTSRDLRTSHPNRIVADAMTPNPIGTASETFIWDALNIMEMHNIERLLVLDKGQVRGLVTRENICMKLSAYIDTMTSLYRAPFIQAIGEDLLNKKQPFILLFIDLNNFGEINKRYGHPIGDDVIIQFSHKLKQLSNEKDYLCRFAGDEFVIIRTYNSTEDLLDYIHLIHPIEHQQFSVSASVGIVNGYEDPSFFTHTFRELLSQASLKSTEAKSVNYVHK